MLAGFQKQLASLDAAVMQAPEEIKLRSQRGDVRLFLGRFRKAIEDFEKMIALDPAQDAPHWRLGIAYYFAGEHAKSAKQFEKYHAYDARDRENGIWKFLAQAKTDGLEKARAEMLVYTRFDREPFPSLYEMFAGRSSGEEVLAEAKTKGLESDAGVMFFAHYYVGLNESLLGRMGSAREHLRKAVALFSPRTARRGGPGYMWHVARLHLETLNSARRE
jgi:lipoprotein NlpI